MIRTSCAIDLYWLPLGAGGNFVRLNGRIYEAIEAAIQRRPRFDLYHSGLEIVVPAGRYTIEQTPARPHGEDRGVVGIGPIGARWASHLRMFRYELRRWKDGVIPDINEAVDSPQRLSSDPADAERLLELVPQVPFLVWGRDELGVGEMWNSNSQIAWLIARVGLDIYSIQPPTGGRAPGWHAGLAAAARDLAWIPESSASISAGRVAWRGLNRASARRGYLRTLNRRMVTAPDRMLLIGSRSILPRPGDEKRMPSPSSTGSK